MYRQEEARNQIKSAFQGDYKTFLRNCQLELVLSPLGQENMDRVYELAQRTNQMNFSGSRYPREQLDTIRRSQNLDTYVMRCTDRFGSYGIVGFAVVDTTEPRLLDLMFSCRIQSKRVEHEFLGYLLEKYGRARKRDFFANYRKTNKNAQAAKVFEEIGFEEVRQEEGVSSLKFPSGRTILQEGIVRIVPEEGESGADGR
jgi:FkbH-like protein